MYIFDVIAGFLAAALAAMGVGGGGLLVIYLTEIADMEQRLAQGINLLFFLCASVSAMAVHLKTRRIAWRAALIFALTGAIGALVGVSLAHRVSNRLLRKAFGILLMYAGGSTLIKTFSEYSNGHKGRKREGIR